MRSTRVGIEAKTEHRGFPRTLRAAAVAMLALLPPAARAERDCLPTDFPLHPSTWGGAGGGLSRDGRGNPRYLPVIMVSGMGRTRRDWTGHNPGNAPPAEGVSVYDHFLRAGFQPIEVWMIDFAAADEQMTSLEEATDDLKFFIAAVLRYTGANKVQILAHGAGCILTRLTLLKYGIAHWIDREVYIDGPFHGVSAPKPVEATLRGHPNAWCFTPGSPLLHDIMLSGESLAFRDPRDRVERRLPAMTLRSGPPAGGLDSPALIGAENVTLPGLDSDGLRCAAASAAVFIPFLTNEAIRYHPALDRDHDGFIGAEHGGQDLDDRDPAVHPGAREIPGDGIDQDCNGHDVSPHGGRDGEIAIPMEPRPRRMNGGRSVTDRRSRISGG